MQVWLGPSMGALGLLLMGAGFPIVIWVERCFGVLAWPYLLLLGVGLVGASAWAGNDVASFALGVFGAVCIWGATELKEQAMRARLGWFAYRRVKIMLPFSDIIKRWAPPHL